MEIRTLGPLVAICLTGCLGLDGSSGGDATAGSDAGSAADGGGAAGDAAAGAMADADAPAPDASTQAPDAAPPPVPDMGTPPASDAGAAPAPDAEPPCDPATWYPDVDGDGLGDERAPISLCEAPDGYVDNGDDLEPECATNDTDDCGLCGGPGPAARYADGDGDGLGDPAVVIELCGDVDGFVDNADDPEPACETNDTDSCGICAGEDEALDCVGVCFGLAIVDGCGQCAGGTTDIAPAIRDSDEDGQPDACDQCPIGDQPRFIVQWDQVVGFAGGGPYTFQVVLYGNGDVSFRYEVIEPFDAQATVGHQGPAGQNPTSLGFNSEFPRNHREVYFYRREDGRLEVDYSIPVPFIDIGWSGEDLDLGDDEEVRVPVGFEFPFNAGAYADVMISSNGFIGLGGGAVPSYNNVSLPAPELSGIIAPLWDDLNPTRGQGRVLVYTADNNCAQDCAGDFGGVAFEDNCGICSGGSTVREPDSSIDCNGVCGGEAYRDICGECVGGNTGLEPSDPAACPQGPDLIVDQSYLSETLELRRQNIEDQCMVNEGCVRGLGERKLLSFGTRIANIGNQDLQLGVPQEENPAWTWDECHGHFHFEAYAGYDLRNLETDEVLPIGVKSGFAVIDIGVWDPEIAVNGCVGYNANNQGITAGCQDTYSPNLPCQWVDITDVPDGRYELIVTTNPDREIMELDYENNAGTVRFELEGDVARVVEE